MSAVTEWLKKSIVELTDKEKAWAEGCLADMKDDVEEAWGKAVLGGEEVSQNPGGYYADEKELLGRYRWDGKGPHEALHTAYVQMETWQQFVAHHPNVLLDKESSRNAQLAHAFMFKTYQAIARREFDETLRGPTDGG